MVKERDSNIELLRIVSALFVTMLHYNYNIAFREVVWGGHNFWVLNLFECISIPAVNLFVIITGYFSYHSNNRKINKPLSLIVQTVIWGILYILFYGLCVEKVEDVALIKQIIACIITPNYFVTLYVVLYIISPYLNYLISSLTERSFRILILYLFLIFSIWATIMDLGNEFLNTNSFDTGSPIGQRGSQFGYTIVHFIFIYLLGAYISKYSLSFSMKSLIFGIILSVLLVFAWRCLDLLYCENSQLSTALSYNNPLVIALSFFIFMLFKELRIKSKIVNELSGAAFTCYLIQGYFLKEINISKSVNGSLSDMLLHVIISLIGIYLVSYFAYKLFSFTFGRIISKIKVQFNY